MINLDKQQTNALARLAQLPDFQVFMQVIETDKADLFKTLMVSRDQVHVHQLQGSAQKLEDILQTIESAQQAHAHRVSP